jgi:hypothetical protein
LKAANIKKIKVIYMLTITSEQDLLYKGVALFVLFLCVLIIIVGIILIHELPYKIAKRRGHNQQDAIRCMAIMGLFIIPLWFFAIIWAYMKGKTFGAPIENANVNLTEIVVDDDSILIDKEKLISNIKQRIKPIAREKTENKTPARKRPPRYRTTKKTEPDKNQNRKTQNEDRKV